MLRSAAILTLLALNALVSPAMAADPATFEEARKASVEVNDLPRVLRPFVTDCSLKQDHFKRLFCEALNQRLIAQHQTIAYRYEVKPSVAGPLVVNVGKGAAEAELLVNGCLTCAKPILPRKSGDISKGRFFMFQQPKTITSSRARGSTTILGTLPSRATPSTFRKRVRPIALPARLGRS